MPSCRRSPPQQARTNSTISSGDSDSPGMPKKRRNSSGLTSISIFIRAASFSFTSANQRGALSRSRARWRTSAMFCCRRRWAMHRGRWLWIATSAQRAYRVHGITTSRKSVWWRRVASTSRRWIYADLDLDHVENVRLQGHVLNFRHWLDQGSEFPAEGIHPAGAPGSLRPLAHRAAPNHPPPRAW